MIREIVSWRQQLPLGDDIDLVHFNVGLFGELKRYNKDTEESS